MKTACFFLFGFLISGIAADHNSANYNALTTSLDGGGSHAVSAGYSADGSFSSFGGVVTAGSVLETNRSGYVGQLYEVLALTVTAPSTNLSAASSMPLFVNQFLDDGTVSPASSFARWSFLGPIFEIDAAGVVTATNVFQNTPATVTAYLEGLSASLNLTVTFTGVLPGFNRINGERLSGGNMRLSFVGSNGVNYALERCYSLLPPISWVPQVTNAIGTNGILIFTNLANPATNNFWRVRSVP